MLSLKLVLLILALICFFSAAIGWPASGRINLIALGLFFWLLTIVAGK